MVKMNSQSRYLFLFLVAALLLVGQMAHAAGETFSDMASFAEECGVGKETVEQVRIPVRKGDMAEVDAKRLLSPLVAACRANYPVGPFADKLAEGFAKHVPPPLIARALEKKLGDYRVAEVLLSGQGTPVDRKLLTIVGEGLFKGVPRSNFESVVRDFDGVAPGLLFAGVQMTSLLTQAGFDFRLTKKILSTGLSSGALDAQWRYFVRVVLVARQRGIEDASICDAAVAVLAGGGPLEDVAVRLGFTNRSMTGRASSN